MSKTTNSRFQLRLNHYVGTFLFVLLFLIVNYFGFTRVYRADLSIGQFLTLSEQSINVARNLPEGVTVTVFVSEQMDQLSQIIQDDVNGLLKEYAHRSGGRLKIRHVNPFLDLEDSAAVAQKFKLTKNENVLIFEKGEQSKVLKVADLAKLDTSMMMYGQAPEVVSFNAEAEITSALISLVQGEKSKIYFTTGHGEADPLVDERMPSGVSILAARIRGQNAEIEKLDMNEVEGIPEDASMVVILGPKTRFSEAQIGMLQAYRARHGKFFVLLDPASESGLEKLFADAGVEFRNDMVLARFVSVTSTGLRQGVTADTTAVEFADHPAISWIKPLDTSLQLGTVRSLGLTPVAPQPGVIVPEVTALASTGARAWGETALAEIDTKGAEYDAKQDHSGPLVVAAAIDSGAVQGGQVNLEGWRAVVVGGSGFLLNGRIGALQADFFLNAMNWMLEKKASLGISPKQPTKFVVSISDAQRRSITLVVLFGIPGLLALLGIMVWLKRRK
jgi:ABC-type uncharacterized transport system involved in gliding motility auxiliary subunit